MIKFTNKKMTRIYKGPSYNSVHSHIWSYESDGSVDVKSIERVIRMECGYMYEDPVTVVVTNLTDNAVHWDECFLDLLCD